MFGVRVSCLLYVWCVFGVCMVCLWYVFGAYVAGWYVFGMCFGANQDFPMNNGFIDFSNPLATGPQ